MLGTHTRDKRTNNFPHPHRSTQAEMIKFYYRIQLHVNKFSTLRHSSHPSGQLLSPRCHPAVG